MNSGKQPGAFWERAEAEGGLGGEDGAGVVVETALDGGVAVAADLEAQGLVGAEAGEGDAGAAGEKVAPDGNAAARERGADLDAGGPVGRAGVRGVVELGR